MSGGGTPPVKPSPDLWVNLGLPSGTLWAKTNMDITQANGFAISEFQLGCSFVSWGNIEMHNPVDDSAFDYDWGSRNTQEPWYEGQPYGQTPGCTIQTNIGMSSDVARVICGSPWRIPKSSDFVELLAYVDFLDGDGQVIDPSVTNKLATVNGVTGLYLQSKINGERLFIACCGYGAGTSLYNSGTGGSYWASDYYNDRSARTLSFGESFVYPSNSSNRCFGMAIRPVWNDIR